MLLACRHCHEPIMHPFKDADGTPLEYVEHVCCLKDAEMSHTHDHRAEPDLRINTQPINTQSDYPKIETMSDKIVVTVIDRRTAEEEILKIAVGCEIESIEILWSPTDLPRKYETGRLRRALNSTSPSQPIKGEK